MLIRSRRRGPALDGAVGSMPTAARHGAARQFAPGLLSAMLALSAASSVGADLFAPREDVAALGSPVAIASGDFDRDGRADVVTVNGDSREVGVFLGRADGTFEPGAAIRSDPDPVALAVADFDGDEKADVVVLDGQTGQARILGGTGRGTFQFREALPVGAWPAAVACGEFDGSGRPGFATANSGADEVGVFVQNGEGHFVPAGAVRVPGSPAAVAAGRFDADPHLDLAVATASPGAVVILLGDGTGAFAADSTVGVGEAPRALDVGDLDGDGSDDLVVANQRSDSASVLLNDGRGRFPAATAYDVGAFPAAVSIGDLDADGRADLVSADGFGSAGAGGGVSVLFGTGGGAFAPAQSSVVSSGPAGVVLRDLQGDGLPDAVSAGADAGALSVLRNVTPPRCPGDCDGDARVRVDELLAAVGVALGDTPAAVCFAADVRRDGILSIDDLVAAVHSALTGCLPPNSARSDG